MPEGLSFGTIDAAVVTNAVIAAVEPAFQWNDMPFFDADAAQAPAVLDGGDRRELIDTREAQKLVGMRFAKGGFRNMIDNILRVTRPSDVERVKHFVMQNPVFIEMLNALSGHAAPMAWGEFYAAVQRGAIDSPEPPIAVVHSNKFADVVKYIPVTRHPSSALRARVHL